MGTWSSGRTTGGGATPRLRRRFSVATLGWSLVYVVRAVSQAAFHVEDEPGVQTVTEVLLGWPLTALAVVLTLAYVRRHRTDQGRP